MNPSKTSEHKDTNENYWEKKTTPHEIQMKKAPHETYPTTWNLECNRGNEVNEANEGT